MSPARPRLPRRVACLVVPHVALQVAARRQPELLAAPAAVTDGRRVLARSPAAAAAGVGVGQGVAEARARCPALALVAGDPAAVAAVGVALAAALDRFSPTVELARPGVAFLDWGGLGRQADGEVGLARLLVETVAAEVGLTARAGIADGPFTAAVAAHRIATAAEPARVPPGGAAAFLAGFELAVLPGIRPLLPRLRALGLARVGDLAGLPAAAVAARFGPPGVQAHALARGQDRRPLRPHAGPAERSTRLAFDPPETALDRLLFAARRALNRLEEELEPGGLAAGGLRLTLELAGGGALPLTAPLLDVAGAGGVALAALRARLDGEPLAAPVAALTVTLTGVGPARGHQLELLAADRAATRPRRLAAVARLWALLGPDGAQRAVLRPALLPEEASHLRPWDDAPAGPPPAPDAVPALLPAAPGLRLVDPPRPVTVALTAGPAVADSFPAIDRLHDGARWRAVAAADGPYRVATGWWPGGRPVGRDYYLVADAAGGLLLLYADHAAGGWWLAAELD